MAELAETPSPKVLKFLPYSYVVSDDYVSTNCWYCLQAPASELALQSCTGCGKAWFCSEKCRNLAKFDHDPECVVFQHEMPSDTVRLLARVCRRYMAGLRGQVKAEEDSYLNDNAERPIMDLCLHKAEQDADPELPEILAKVNNLYNHQLLPDDGIRQELLYRLLVNNFNVYVDELSVGLALYLDLSRYDHSCAPNAFFEFYGFEVHIRGLDGNLDIRDPSATYISYLKLMQTRDERRAELRGKPWYFECECSRCMDDNGDEMLEAIKCQACQKPVALLWVKCKNCENPVDKELGQLANSNANKLLDEDPFWSMESIPKLVFGAEKVIAGLRKVLADTNINLVKVIRMVINNHMRLQAMYGAGQSNYAEMIVPHYTLVLPAARKCYPDRSRDLLMVLLLANHTICSSLTYCYDEAYLPFVEEIRRILVWVYGNIESVPSRRPYGEFCEFLSSVEPSLEEYGYGSYTQDELIEAQMEVLAKPQWST